MDFLKSRVYCTFPSGFSDLPTAAFSVKDQSDHAHVPAVILGPEMEGWEMPL